MHVCILTLNEINAFQIVLFLVTQIPNVYYHTPNYLQEEEKNCNDTGQPLLLVQKGVYILYLLIIIMNCIHNWKVLELCHHSSNYFDKVSLSFYKRPSLFCPLDVWPNSFQNSTHDELYLLGFSSLSYLIWSKSSLFGSDHYIFVPL